jgi:hypothetical protein
MHVRRQTAAVLGMAAFAWLLGGASTARAGLVITPIFDSSITSDPNAAAIEHTINQTIQIYENKFSDPINVAIKFAEMTTGLGSSSTFFATGPYATFITALHADATSADDATALSLLPIQATNPVTGTSFINVKTANLRAVGINVSPPVGSPDGSIGLNTHITDVGSPGTTGQYSLMTTTAHEIDEVLGLGSAIDFSSSPFPEDLFRYDASGNRSFTNNPAAQAFFSINATTLLAQFDNQNDGGDWGDWQSNPHPAGVQPKVQDAFATPGASPTLGVELTALDVIGYDLTPSAATPEPATIIPAGIACLMGLGYSWRRRAKSAA